MATGGFGSSACCEASGRRLRHKEMPYLQHGEAAGRTLPARPDQRKPKVAAMQVVSSAMRVAMSASSTNQNNTRGTSNPIKTAAFNIFMNTKPADDGSRAVNSVTEVRR